MNKPHIYMQPLKEHQARSVAAMLRRSQYQIRIEDCRKKSPLEIAAYLHPLDEEARNEVMQEIAEAAGIVPRRKKGK